MKKKKGFFPLVMHGIVSLLLPVPCYLIMFVLNAFLTFLVPGSADAAAGASIVSISPLLVSAAFSLSGIWRSIRLLRRSKKGGKRFKKCVACLIMSSLGLVVFFALMVLVLRY